MRCSLIEGFVSASSSLSSFPSAFKEGRLRFINKSQDKSSSPSTPPHQAEARSKGLPGGESAGVDVK